MAEKFYSKEFKYSGNSFEDAVGNADSLNDAVGRVAMSFSMLEDQVSSAISYLLHTTTDKGLIVTCEMSFRAKINVLASIMQIEYRTVNFDAQVSEDEFNEMLYMCRKSEGLRNKLLHSSWIFDRSKKEIRRRKVSAKSRNGLVKEDELLSPGQVLDIADYIVYTSVSIEEYFSITYSDYVSA